jgi:hypothetical protein
MTIRGKGKKRCYLLTYLYQYMYTYLHIYIYLYMHLKIYFYPFFTGDGMKVRGEGEGKVLFINFCSHPAIEAPKDSNGKEVDKYLYSICMYL